MSSEQVPDVKSEVTRLFECCICRQGLQDAHLCPGCSQPFCRTCIDEWLTNTENCPCCRRELSTSAVVKARTFDQMQQVFNRLVIGDTRNRCSKHRKEQLLFFCFPCGECVCACCMYSEPHQEHKERIVLLDIAYGKYKNKLTATLKSLEDCKAVLKQSLKQTQMELLLLEEDCARTRSQVDMLMTDEKNATTLVKMMEVLKNSEKYHLPDNLTIYQWMPKAVTLKIRFNRYVDQFQKAKNGICIASSLTRDGFTWSLKFSKDTIALQLDEGIPGEYALVVGNNPAVIKKFELREFVDIADHSELQKDSSTGVAEFEMHIQQARSHAEKCIHLKNYVKRLEASKHEQLMPHPFIDLKLFFVLAICIFIFASGIIFCKAIEKVEAVHHNFSG